MSKRKPKKVRETYFTKILPVGDGNLCTDIHFVDDTKFQQGDLVRVTVTLVRRVR